MATNKQQGKQQGNRQSAGDDDQNQSNVIVEQEQIRRITVGDVIYESHSGGAKEGPDEEHITVKVGDKETTLNPSDVDQLSRFFGRVVRYNANQQRTGGRGATDGRGSVNHPSTDSRLKGNEDQRPGDPSGNARAGRS